MSEKKKEVRYIAQKFANAILAEVSPYVVSTDGLQALNAFLDELLFILVDTAKGLETARIKASVYQIFPTALGKNAIVEAELEAKSYLDMGGKDTNNHMSTSGVSGTSAIFNADSDETRVEQVFEQFRAKCQYYSKLGERLGSPAGNPSNSIVVPTLIAIYVTAVLEHVAEYVLQSASTIADRQDHADMITVREVYVSLLEDRQIEKTFESMILKSQLQKRFRNSLIMPGTGSKPEEQTPATVKRSGSWGKQLRLGNSDKPKLDVALPTDVDDDEILIDPNRPQFGDWDEPPDEENRLKKKNDFEMLFSSGETMKVSLTPNRLRTIEVHRKTATAGGAIASRSSSRAASVFGGKTHARRPSTPGEPHTSSKKNNHPDSQGLVAPPLPVPAMPNIPDHAKVSAPILKKQSMNAVAAAAADLPHSQPKQQQQPSVLQSPVMLESTLKSTHESMDAVRTSTSTFESQLTYSTAGGSSATPNSPIASRSPTAPSGAKHPPPHPLGSLKGAAQATNDLEQLMNNSSTKTPIVESGSNDPPLTPTSDSSKKDGSMKNLMGRLGRNSFQKNPADSSNVASSPTSIRSFTITGPNVAQYQQQPSPISTSTPSSTNSSIHSGHTGQTSIMSPPSTMSQPSPIERRGSGQNIHDLNRFQQQQQQQQQQQHQQQSSPSTANKSLPYESRSSPTIAGFPMPPESKANNLKNINTTLTRNQPPHPPNNIPSSTNANVQNSQRPMSPETNGIPIPSRNASLNHEVTSPVKQNFSNNSYESRTGLEAGLPRPLSPRPLSPRPNSPLSSSPRSNSPLQSRSNTLDGQAGGIISPSPLSNSITGSNVSPSGSSTSLITVGKVQHIQERLSKTFHSSPHGYKPQEHLQNQPNRISLEGTIRANPFYQQDRSSSVRSSLADLSSIAGSNNNSAEIHSLPPKSTASPSQVDSDVDPSPDMKDNNAPVSRTASSDSDSDVDGRHDRKEDKNKDGMVSPATSPEMTNFKDRLPSATTRTLAAAAAAAKQQQKQDITAPTSPSSKRNSGEESTTGINDASNEQKDQEEEEVPYVTPVPRNITPSANRHSIFVDEAAQAMDALSRARHRQSMGIDGNQLLDSDDSDDDSDDDMNGEIQPPEKWHYSDLEDEDDDDEDDDEFGPNGERRRKHESFMSAKSVLPNGSSVSLVDASNDTQDEDDSSNEMLTQEKEEEKPSETLDNEDEDLESKSGNPGKDVGHIELVPAVDTQDAQNGEDEHSSESTDDLDDGDLDDEESQDRRIYLQNLRTQKREARRLERLAGETGETKSARKPNIESTTTAANTTESTTKKKVLKKGRSKENLRSNPDRPQTPTTPVPTTQVIPLTPTDFVLIRQKLFAAGNFEASMRMLDTIFHAAMAKMVEGRERGVQTEPVSFLDHEVEPAEPVAKEIKPTAGVSTSTSTTSTNGNEAEPHKQLQWVEVSKPVAPIEDDDDEDRVVEWLLGGV
ncbi:hypothetical protein BGZ76_002234 [Entomortierella beljakovae]|nr:hypothetical protein BGZ76_002234 [Entomortierella beljakovae]